MLNPQGRQLIIDLSKWIDVENHPRIIAITPTANSSKVVVTPKIDSIA